tara:strand:- start:763 stop:942 length:180 start_codon:yes stop_codon:yes gene_type:complete
VTIIVDYNALKRQLRTLEALYGRMVSGPHVGDEADSLSAAYTLLWAIYNERPFPEGMNQ